MEDFLKNRLVRNYLNNFPEQHWKQAAKLTLIYGIQAIQEHYPLQQLTLDNLKNILQSNNAFQTVEDNIPLIQERLEQIEQNLLKFRKELQDNVR